MVDHKEVIVLKDEDRSELERWVRSETCPQDMANRARIILALADGEGVRALARRMKTAAVVICRWEKRWSAEGLAGLKSRHRSGRGNGISEDDEHKILQATMRPPKHATHWSARRLSKEIGFSASTILRVWRRRGLKPHRVETFKFSKDPNFKEKLTDVVGLYLDPPERALVLCVDEKSQIQALNRTEPLLPLRPGLPAGMTHDYKRNGTTSLFAALEVATGRVHARCFRRHRHEEFVEFLKSIHAAYGSREIHLICDNYGTHKHPTVRAWLAKHPNFHVHFTPTSASWLNLVERWFGIITQQAIRRGSFRSVSLSATSTAS